jgi:ABC-type transport system involved in cytochrome c biogenesis permease subunit
VAWTLVLVYFVAEHLVKLKVFGILLVPMAAVLMLMAQLLGVGSAGAGLSPAEAVLLDHWRVGIHVALIMLANAGFAVGAVASAGYLLMQGQLKSHRTNTLFKRLPSLAQTDQLARRAIACAFPAYTAGLLLGTVRAIETDLAGWWADPRVMVAGAVWAIFGSYLYLHYATQRAGKRIAWIAIVGFVFVVVLAVLARTVPSGFHIFGTGA